MTVLQNTSGTVLMSQLFATEEETVKTLEEIRALRKKRLLARKLESGLFEPLHFGLPPAKGNASTPCHFN